MRKKFLKVMGTLGSTACAVASAVTPAMASSAFDGITGKPGKNDVFGGMTNVAKDVGNSAINLFTVGGAILVVGGIILCGMSLVAFKGDAEVMKNKKHLLAIIGGACLIFGAIGIGNGVANIGGSVGDSFKTNSSETNSSDVPTGYIYDGTGDDARFTALEDAYGISLTVGDGLV